METRSKSEIDLKLALGTSPSFILFPPTDETHFSPHPDRLQYGGSKEKAYTLKYGNIFLLTQKIRTTSVPSQAIQISECS